MKYWCYSKGHELSGEQASQLPNQGQHLTHMKQMIIYMNIITEG